MIKYVNTRTLWSCIEFIFTARNEVGARLYFHRRLWFCPREGGVCSQGDAWSGGVCAWSGGCLVRGCLVWGVPGSGGVPAPGGVCLLPGDVCSQGVPALGGGVWGPGPGGFPGGDPPETATAAGGMHPTGMHSCWYYVCLVNCSLIFLKRSYILKCLVLAGTCDSDCNQFENFHKFFPKNYHNKFIP